VHAALAAPVPTSPSRLRLVVVMSDGFLGNEADVLSEIARGLGDARLYALGFGASPNRFLLERAAEIGRGRAVFVAPSEDADAAAARFATWIEHPVFTDVSIDWGGLAVGEVYPRHLPDLFLGKPLVLTGRYARGGKAKVRVQGTYAGKRYERAIDVELPETVGDPRGAERILWARAAVHDRMQAMTLHDDPQLIEEVTQIGMANHLVTPWTSLVAVEAAPGAPLDASTRTEVDVGATSMQAMLSPARTLPGDPEVRIAAPADARAVTVDLPFGETIVAHWDAQGGDWVARFLVPRDAAEGAYRVRVTITLADGTRQVRNTGYAVDASAPKLAFEVRGEPRPGELVTVRGAQVATAGRRSVVADTRRVELRMPDGTVFPMAQTARGVWESRVRIPERTSGTLHIHAYAIDQAANVGQQDVAVEIQP
jgi:Ca-activated chloride channel family protein